MITDINKIAEKAGPKEIELSGWDDEPFVCRLCRPQVIAMAGAGQIPNPILPIVDKMFVSPAMINQIPISDTARVMLTIARAALVEPTAKQLDDIGVSLTDNQISEIYAYVTGGAATLARFRGNERAAVGDHGGETGDAAVGAVACG